MRLRRAPRARAQGDFAVAGRAAREEQVRDVCTRGSQHEPDEAHEDVEWPRKPPPHIVFALAPRVGHERLVVGHSFVGRCSRTPREPPLARRVLKDWLERRADVRRRRSRCQPPHDAEPPIPGLCSRRPIGLEAQVMGEWHRHVRRFTGLHRYRRTPRCHANDGHGDPVRDVDRPAQDIGVATEAAFPVAERNYGHRFCRGSVILGRERPPEKGRHAEPAVVTAGNELRRLTGLRLAVDEDVDLRERREGEDVRQRRPVPRSRSKVSSENDVLANRPVSGSIDPLFSPPRDMRPCRPSTVRSRTSSSGFRTGSVPQEDVADEAEDRRIGTDAERQGQ